MSKMNRPLLSNFRSNPCNSLKILCLTLGILSLTACNSVSSPDKLTRTLTVSGKGDVTIPTTITQVSLGVQVQSKTAADVQQELARRSQAVVELLTSRQVEKLETSAISLNPNYSYKNDVQRLTGYSGNNIVNFRIDTQKSGNLLDEAIAAGATRIDGVSFVASESALAAAKQQAIKQASEDAKKQADAALTALNLSQQEVVSIQIDQANAPEPRSYRLPVGVKRSFQATEATPPRIITPVVAAQQQVEATVTLEIRY